MRSILRFRVASDTPGDGRKRIAASAMEVAHELDEMLLAPFAHRSLPQVVWAFDPTIGVCRRVRWTDANEPWKLRRTALAIARQEGGEGRSERN